MASRRQALGNILPHLAGTTGTHWDALGHWDKGQKDSRWPTSYALFGKVGRSCGVTRPFVFCSKAYAYLINVGSLHAVPKKNIPVDCMLLGAAGKFPAAAAAGTSRRPSGTVIDG